MEQFSFPLMDQGEILECLNDLGIAASPEDLTKPKAEPTRRIFEKFVEMLLGLRKEDCAQPSFAAIDCLEYPELHQDSISELAMNNAVLKLMNAAGVYNFSLSHLDAPDAKSLRRNLSAIINFTKFREEKISAFYDFQEKQEHLEEEKLKLEHHVQELSTNIRSIKNQRDKEQPTVDELESEAQGLIKELKSLDAQQKSLQAKIQETKQETSRISDKIVSTHAPTSVHVANSLVKANDKFDIMTYKQDNEKMQNQIVQSPERLKKTIHDMGASLESEKENVQSVEKRHKDLIVKSQSLDKVHKRVVKSNALLNDLEGEMEKHRVALKDVKNLQGDIAKSGTEKEELLAQQQLLQKQVASSEEKLARFQKQQDVKQEHAKESFNAAVEMKRAAENDRLSTLCQAEDNELATQRVHTMMTEAKNEHEAELKLLQKLHNDVESSVREYHNRLFEAMDVQSA